MHNMTINYKTIKIGQIALQLQSFQRMTMAPLRLTRPEELIRLTEGFVKYTVKAVLYN